MNSSEENCRADIVRLTKVAAEAAELGRWDVVAQCYRERGDLLVTMQTPIREAGDLLQLDDRIRTRVHVVQGTIACLLDEVTVTKQRLHDLHQRLGVSASTPVTVSRKA